MFVVAISGPPGAGKGTQSKFLIEEFDFKYISTGEALRKEIKSGSELGKHIQLIIDKGNLVSDEIVTDIVKNVVKKNMENNSIGILFDGYPRTVSQAITLDNVMKENGIHFVGMIWLEVNDEILVKRILKRGETSGRHDDNEESVKCRLNEYYAKTQPIADYYKKQSKYFAINGEGELADIYDSICTTIKKHL